ncbi:glycogen debranching protein GlgX [Pseudoalteromonas denitrificans]|uniref:Glycogen operon protein n=1 Tax=Pseudoalteromonas denitrificans DSM 6059 TaxID=1123010 RepID=A0A1I1PR19_9GAMM|nr:glycogen debranching protein GlgX [Pseudoalteromonas denitrificans]SFD12256.1 glycogen operon protein [Pseudoalteromonas denitrificans DSM 6059]
MSYSFELEQGAAYPLGATLMHCANSKTTTVNFAIYSSSAKKVELCLFDDTGEQEVARFSLFKGSAYIWHGKIIGMGIGQLYGYRISGEFEPQLGLRFNPNKLLVDPYSKDFFGQFNYSKAFDYILNSNDENALEEINNLDSAGAMPKSKVSYLAPYQGEKPNIAWSDTVIYECHVKGGTINNTLISQENRGKYLGLAEPAFIAHLKNLGITTLELLPVQQYISERFLSDKNLTNYWGYNTFNFFTPHKEYLSQGEISEFQTMVKILHEHKIEVVLDVVFNHTAEGNNQGPTLCFRGIDNASYYRLDPNDLSNYINDTGCGNTLNLSHPRTLQLVMDSLRYWVEIMGVDGFRFDLAPILGRESTGFKSDHSFFQAINQDPILNQVKLIAEPWDIGPGGYQLGNFPAAWREWNDKYRDTVRRFWRGDTGLLPEFAQRFHGSNDLFEHNGRDPSASINFISAHDGFTLADLVSYQDKHNEDNGEDNRDGHSENLSANYGTEGPSNDIALTQLRLKQQKNILLTLLFSQGVPMICSGTESEHSQDGNNNAYCQDNNINWLADQNVYSKSPLYRFISKACLLRKQFKIFKQNRFIHQNDGEFELIWLNQNSTLMSELDWQLPHNHMLGYLLVSKHAKNHNDVLLILFNASTDSFVFKLPKVSSVYRWHVRLNTLAHPDLNEFYAADQSIAIASQSAWILSGAKEGRFNG